MIAEWEDRFAPAVLPEWFWVFDRTPLEAIDSLLLGRFYFGHLNAAEPRDLLIDWADLLQETGSFVSRLDETLERWVQENWGKLGHVSAARLAVAWCRLADVVAYIEDLGNTAQRLRGYFEERNDYLGTLSDGPSRDAVGRYLYAVGRHQKDRSLASFWWQLCELRAGTPFYHGRYAIAGLRGLPRPRGEFPEDVTLGLAKLGKALDRLATEGPVFEPGAEGQFLEVGRLCMAAYPFRGEWRRSLAPALSGASERFQHWLHKLIPEIATPVRDAKAASQRRAGRPSYDQTWKDRAMQLEKDLAVNPDSALQRAEQLLEEERRYAEASGDSGPVGMSLRAFSRSVRTANPSKAVEWAEEATRWEPWMPQSWGDWTVALRMAHDITGALSVAWEAVERFPQNAHHWSQLIQVLLDAGKLAEAEQVARDAVERFPTDEYLLNALATILRDSGKLEEAERLARKMVHDHPKDAPARKVLGSVLVRAGKVQEAEVVFGEGRALFPQNQRFWMSLAAVLRLEAKLAEAEEVLSEARVRFPDNVFVWGFLGQVLREAGKLPEAQEVLRQAVGRFNDPVPMVTLAGVLRESGEQHLEEALGLVERALRLNAADPLAWAEKARILEALGRRPEALEALETARRIEPPALGEQFDLFADVLEEEPPGMEPAPETEMPPRMEVQKPGGPKAPVLLPKPARLERHMATVTINEARLLRRWARRNEGSDEEPAPAKLRQKAKELLEEVLAVRPSDARASVEKGHLLIESGLLGEAREFLTQAISLIPGVLPLRRALARVERELARQQRLAFDQELYAKLTKPLLELRGMNRAFEPLVHLGQGRACLALTDGNMPRQIAARAFDRLHEYVRATEKNPLDDFGTWWSGEIENSVFAGIEGNATIDSVNLGAVENSLQENSRRIDVLEEDFECRLMH